MTVSLEIQPLLISTSVLYVPKRRYGKRTLSVSLMALSPFKTPQSPLNRSRSSSCSSPVRNRIVYQEVFSIGPNTLVRSYSCDQVFDKDEKGRTYQTTQIQVSSFITPEKCIHTRSDENKVKKTPRLALEFPTEQPHPKKIKTETLKQPVLHSMLKKTMAFTLLSIMSATALYFFLSYRECGYVWDLEKTNFEMKQNIFGQDNAVKKINSVLKMCNNARSSHILVFTGDVGVGKTYTSSIISRNFPWSSNTLITYSENFPKDTEKLKNQKLSNCGSNLVIVDDLSPKSVNDAVHLTHFLIEKRKNNENLLVILIFQTRTDTDKEKIENVINKNFGNVSFISFRQLNKAEVSKCFKFEMQRQDVIIPSVELNKLINAQMKHVDVVGGQTGCKGVTVHVASYYKKNLS